MTADKWRFHDAYTDAVTPPFVEPCTCCGKRTRIYLRRCRTDGKWFMGCADCFYGTEGYVTKDEAYETWQDQESVNRIALQLQGSWPPKGAIAISTPGVHPDWMSEYTRWVRP